MMCFNPIFNAFLTKVQLIPSCIHFLIDFESELPVRKKTIILYKSVKTRG